MSNDALRPLHKNLLLEHVGIFDAALLHRQIVAIAIGGRNVNYFLRTVPVYLAILDRDNRVVVSRLAGILRVAVALDHTGSQRVRDIECTIERHRLVITVRNSAGDLSLERMELRQKALLLEDTFGFGVLLRESPR